MDKETEPVRLVRLSARADAEIVSNYEYTSIHWGIPQAERYSEYLIATMRELAERPGLGSIVDGGNGARVFFARWHRAKHGHHIVYRPTDDGIYVLRVLHSAAAADIEGTTSDSD